jgi:hypothetical protein
MRNRYAKAKNTAPARVGGAPAESTHQRCAHYRVADKRVCRQSRRGFTLLEAAMTVTIIGVGVLAMVEAQQAFIQSNLWSSHAATGAYLGGEIRERMRNLPRHDPAAGLVGPLYAFGTEANETTIDDLDDIDDYHGLIFGAGGDFPGPIDALGRLVPQIDNLGNLVFDEDDNQVGMLGWSQEVIVEKVEPFDTSVARADGYYRVGPDSDDTDAPVGNAGSSEPPLGVEDFPLRVTVIVRFRPDRPDSETAEMSRVSWIVPR